MLDLLKFNKKWKEIIYINKYYESNNIEFDFWKSPHYNYNVLLNKNFDNVYSSLENYPKKIHLFDSNIKSITPIKDIDSLREFYCGENPIENLSPLNQHTKLEKLCCYKTDIKSLKGLDNLLLLRRLCISKTNIVNIDRLEKLKNLEVLALYNTKVESLEALSSLQNLLKLNINFTHINSLKPLYNLKKLKELHCYKTNISIEEINNFKKNTPSCKVIYTYEQDEKEYDDFEECLIL